jgi:hypothetical protein
MASKNIPDDQGVIIGSDRSLDNGRGGGDQGQSVPPMQKKCGPNGVPWTNGGYLNNHHKQAPQAGQGRVSWALGPLVGGELVQFVGVLERRVAL